MSIHSLSPRTPAPRRREPDAANMQRAEDIVTPILAERWNRPDGCGGPTARAGAGAGDRVQFFVKAVQTLGKPFMPRRKASKRHGHHPGRLSHFLCRQLELEALMALSAHLSELFEKHRQLDRRIEEEMARPGGDQTRLNRLKLEKLRLKDEIARLEKVTRH